MTSEASEAPRRDPLMWVVLPGVAASLVYAISTDLTSQLSRNPLLAVLWVVGLLMVGGLLMRGAREGSRFEVAVDAVALLLLGVMLAVHLLDPEHPLLPLMLALIVSPLLIAMREIARRDLRACAKKWTIGCLGSMGMYCMLIMMPLLLTELQFDTPGVQLVGLAVASSFPVVDELSRRQPRRAWVGGGFWFFLNTSIFYLVDAWVRLTRT